MTATEQYISGALIYWWWWQESSAVRAAGRVENCNLSGKTNSAKNIVSTEDVSQNRESIVKGHHDILYSA